MATTRSFDTMLNEYAPNKLFKEELKKRNWLYNNIEKDDSWLGGSLIVPFLGANASSVAFGSLTDTTDVAEDVAVRGSVTAYKEAWGTLKFNETDLMQHGKMSEQNLMKILPDQITYFMDYFANVISTNMLIGAAFDVLTADGDASGNITVGHPERFVIGQKVSLDDDDSSPVTGYVKTVAMDTGVINLVTARSGATPVNASTYTVAQNAKVYNDGQQSNGFLSLKEGLLSSANGGSSTLYGQTKSTYPYLQAINVSGSTVTASNILSKIFDAYVQIRNKGKGKPFKVVMSYKNFGSCVKNLEDTKGAYNVKQGSANAEVYGWDEIQVGGFAGTLSLVAVQEMSDSEIFFLDMNSMKFYSNGGIKKRIGPDGLSFFTARATTGYSYYVDVCLFGELVLEHPSSCGILHSISYTV